MPEKFNVPVDAFTIEEGVKWFDVSKEVQEKLNQMGLREPERPTVMGHSGVENYQGQIPADLTVLTDNELHIQMTLLDKWKAWIIYHRDMAWGSKNMAMEQFEFVCAKLRTKYKFDENMKKRPEQERKDLTRLDQEYLKFSRNVLYTEQIYQILKGICTVAETNWDTVSRRITQRTTDVSAGKRMGNVSNVNIGPAWGGRRP